jgi:hypothetical protein
MFVVVRLCITLVEFVAADLLLVVLLRLDDAVPVAVLVVLRSGIDGRQRRRGSVEEQATGNQLHGRIA